MDEKRYYIIEVDDTICEKCCHVFSGGIVKMDRALCELPNFDYKYIPIQCPECETNTEWKRSSWWSNYFLITDTISYFHQKDIPIATLPNITELVMKALNIRWEQSIEDMQHRIIELEALLEAKNASNNPA